MSSPTQRSLALLRELGYTPYVTEYWNAYARIRKDLFGFIDIVALRENENGVMGIQTTTGSNMSARVAKATANPICKLWIQCGNKMIFHGWRKLLKKKGGKQRIWSPLVYRLIISSNKLELIEVDPL